MPLKKQSESYQKQEAYGSRKSEMIDNKNAEIAEKNACNAS